MGARKTVSPKSNGRRLGVVVVDPLPVVRAGLRLLIDDSPDMEVIGEAGSSSEAIEHVSKIRRTRVVILVGLGLADEQHAYSLVRTLRERWPSHAILGVGANAAPSMISRALFMGADGYVDKNVDPGNFLQAVRDAALGVTVLATPPEVSVADVAVGLDRRRRSDFRLTEREREVLEVAAEGLTAREIAVRLGVRERTITTHLARIYGKLGVGTRLAAIRTATRSGLVTIAAGE